MERNPSAEPQKPLPDPPHSKGREPTQHDLMDKHLPKKDVAEGLEDFDGDEA